MRNSRVTTHSVSCLAGSLVFLVASACAAIRPASILEQYNPDATATAVRFAVEQFHDGLRTRNIEKILTAFITDTSFRAYDGDEGWLTFDNIRLQDAVAIRRLRSVSIHLDSMSIAVLDPSAAVVSSNLRESFTDSAGHERRLRVTQTMVWTRRAEGWRIAHLHSWRCRTPRGSERTRQAHRLLRLKEYDRNLSGDGIPHSTHRQP